MINPRELEDYQDSAAVFENLSWFSKNLEKLLNLHFNILIGANLVS